MPPRMGPTALAKAHTMPVIAKYWPRLRMLNRSLMQILTKIIKPPPPTPWTARAAISMPMETLVAANRLPTQNTADASIRMGLRPQMSENLPQEGVDAAFASRTPSQPTCSPPTSGSVD